MISTILGLIYLGIINRQEKLSIMSNNDLFKDIILGIFGLSLQYILELNLLLTDIISFKELNINIYFYTFMVIVGFISLSYYSYYAEIIHKNTKSMRSSMFFVFFGSILSVILI